MINVQKVNVIIAILLVGFALTAQTTAAFATGNESKSNATDNMTDPQCPPNDPTAQKPDGEICGRLVVVSGPSHCYNTREGRIRRFDSCRQ
ncbi:MAG: hypothetical protein WBZ36_29525 [Candidatus Nitrosopolaris sp.]